MQVGTPLQVGHRSDHVRDVFQCGTCYNGVHDDTEFVRDALFDQKPVQLSLSIAGVVTWSEAGY